MGSRETKGGPGTYFAIPAKGQVFGVVNDLVLFILTFALTDLLLLLLLSLFSCPGLLGVSSWTTEWPPRSRAGQHGMQPLLFAKEQISSLFLTCTSFLLTSLLASLSSFQGFFPLVPPFNVLHPQKNLQLQNTGVGGDHLIPESIR